MKLPREESRLSVASVALLTAFLGPSACSRGGGTNAPPAAPDGAGRGVESACQRVALKTVDLTGILRAPITRASAVPGDVQSCSYLTEGFAAITVSVRPGVGESTLDAWAHGKMPFEVRPISGVGDSALWQAALNELIARKGGLL